MFDRKLFGLPGAHRAFAVCCLLAFVGCALAVGEAACLAIAVSDAWAGTLQPRTAGLVVGFGLCLAARYLVSHVRALYMGRFSADAVGALRHDALEALADSGMARVHAQGSGSTVALLAEGARKVGDYLTLELPKTADLAAAVVVYLAALFALDPLSGAIALVMLPCIVFYMKLLGGYAHEKAQAQFASYRNLSNHFADSLAGVSTLMACGAERTRQRAVYERSEQLREATVSTLKIATISSLVLDLFRVFALAAIAVMLGFRLMDGVIDLAPALMLLVLVPELFGTIRRWAADFHASLDGAENLAALLALGQAVEVAEDPGYPDAVGAPSLELAGVAFRYDDGDGDALGGIDLHVEAGERIGVVGGSGAGKSTFAALLAGSISPSEGTVRVEGVEGGTLACASWRGRVAYLPQKPHIFTATLAENVAFYNPHASREQIERALEQAGLGDFVSGLEDGIDTLVGQGARQLSGGQAQRVALARVFADPARTVLIFDEPTAHLDFETEFALKDSFRALMEGKTVFFATHRLHWMADMDCILVMDGGCVVQEGALAQLQSEPGPYLQLARALDGEVRS